MESAVTLSTLDRAEQVLAKGDIESALALVRKLYGQTLPSADRGRALAIEVVCLERLTKLDEAGQLVTAMMKEDGDDHEYVLAAGIQFSELDSYHHAEVYLRNLCELEPKNPLSWHNLAIALGRGGQYAEAAKAYDECIARDPVFPDPHLQKAYCLELTEDLEGSAQAYRRYLELVPDDAESWKALGIVESDQRRFGPAYEAFARAAEHSREPEDVYFNWAITAIRNGDSDQQEACIEKLLELDPDGWRTLLTRADHDELAGQTWPAWEFLGEAFESVAEDEDETEALSYVAATLLRFAHRQGMRDHAQEYVLRIFDRGLFTEEVIEALQTLEGRVSNSAASFQAVVKRTADGADRFVVYGVSAEEAEEAGRLAIDFEERCGASAESSLYSLHQLTAPDEGLIGVYWRSDEYDRPPVS